MEELAAAYSPRLVSAYSLLVNGLLAVLFIVPFAGPIPAGVWALGGWIGVTFALANIAFIYGLHMVGSTRISLFTMIQRPLLIALAALILKEALSIQQIVAVVVVLIGIQLAEVKRVSAGRHAAPEPAPAGR